MLAPVRLPGPILGDPVRATENRAVGERAWTTDHGVRIGGRQRL